MQITEAELRLLPVFITSPCGKSLREDGEGEMKSDLGSEINCSGHSEATEAAAKPPDPVSCGYNDSDWMDHCYVSRVRPSEANGLIVYTRRAKRLKCSVVDVNGSLDKLQDISTTSSCNAAPNTAGASNLQVKRVNSEVLNLEGEWQMTEIEVKEEIPVEREGTRMLSRSVYGLKDEQSELQNGNSENLRDAVILVAEDLVNGQLQVSGSSETSNITMMSKNALLKGRPTTVRELFETGLLEGYPVFYNGGKRGFPLRGTVKDAGILCTCILCRGIRVVPPCQFEIHACRTYRRASQYICFVNGKSLLDVVKECRKSSVKSLEETLLMTVGPRPVKESVICGKCGMSFLSTSNGEMEPLCDSCLIAANSGFQLEYVESGPSVPELGLLLKNGDSRDGQQNVVRRGRKRKNFELTTKKTKSSLLGRKKKSRWKIKNSLSSSPFDVMSPVNPSSTAPTSNSSASLHGSLNKKDCKKILKKLSSTKSLVKSLKDESGSYTGQLVLKITKKDQRMHKLVFENGGLPDGTEVAYYSNGKKLRDGYKMGCGIICGCCSTLVSPSQFESHAGWASRRKPYMHIYTSNGVSLHEYALSLLKGRKSSSKDNDDLCIICADGGELVMCDGCPRSFHQECASLPSIPRGKWYCTYCQNMFQRERSVMWNANAVAAGRVSGVDPIEQITDRCIRIVKNPEENDVIACVICRGYDFSKSGFGPRTVILCDQCEKEYHVGCLKKCKLADLKELPRGKWFCSSNCRWIYSALHSVLSAGEERLPYQSPDIIRKKTTGNNPGSDTDLDIRWRLLNGKISCHESRVLLSQAVAIFHECFDPIVDSETGRDFIPSLVYGRNIRGQDFGGMYCAILTVNSIVVSAGILRIFGDEIAELPLVATRLADQGKGYFQLLYSCVEKLLAFLNVKILVLPATDEARSIWIEKFGFEKIPLEQLTNYRKTCWQMITFKGTSMLEKPVPKCRIINQAELPDVHLE